MPLDSRVHELLSMWEKEQAEGRPRAPEDLCREHPELLDELKKNLALLQSANQMLRAGPDVNPAARPTLPPLKQTPYSLLERLRRAGAGDHTDPDEASAEARRRLAHDWSRFNHLFAPVLCALADRLCPRDDDAKELLSELYIALRDKIAAGKYDAGKGRFRAWLAVVARNKWLEILRKRAVRDKGKHELVEEPAVPDNVADFFQREFDLTILNRALDMLKSEFMPATWTAFQRMVIQQHAPAAVALELGMTANAVYAARFRVLARLRQELRGLVD